jgi:sulfite exporter TauE/SafE
MSYQIGRLVSYLMIGVMLFYGIKYFLNTESRPLKIFFSLFLGFLFILFGLAQMDIISIKRWSFKYYKLQHVIIEKNKKMAQRFPIVLGLLTGFFPCGWLYSFLLLSSQMKTIHESLIVIFIFWVTAIPALMVLSGFMRNLLKATPVSHQTISGVILIISGLLSILGHWTEIISNL